MADKSEDLISQLVDGIDSGALVTKFVIIAEGFDKDGRRAIYSATHNEATPWDIFGLLEFGMAREQAVMLRREIDFNS